MLGAAGAGGAEPPHPPAAAGRHVAGLQPLVARRVPLPRKLRAGHAQLHHGLACRSSRRSQAEPAAAAAAPQPLSDASAPVLPSCTARRPCSCCCAAWRSASLPSRPACLQLQQRRAPRKGHHNPRRTSQARGRSPAGRTPARVAHRLTAALGAATRPPRRALVGRGLPAGTAAGVLAAPARASTHQPAPLRHSALVRRGSMGGHRLTAPARVNSGLAALGPGGPGCKQVAPCTEDGGPQAGGQAHRQ